MTYDKIIAEDILRRTFRGETLETIVKDYGDLSEDNVHDWMADNDGFRTRYIDTVMASTGTFLNKMIGLAQDSTMPLAERKFRASLYKDMLNITGSTKMMQRIAADTVKPKKLVVLEDVPVGKTTGQPTFPIEEDHPLLKTNEASLDRRLEDARPEEAGDTHGL